MYLDPKNPAVPPSFGFPKRADDKFIIAQRYVGTAWPRVGREGEAIERARKAYEQGKAEMAQRREGRMEYLYSIPRRTQGTLRPAYFKRSI